LNRWTLSGLAGVETGSVNSNVPLFNSLGLPAPSVSNRFFDDVRALYYFTDNFGLYAGHAYTGGTHFLTLGGEYGIALGGGRMASLFTDGWIGEGGDIGAFVGLRVYFGQHDKTLIRRHREDDPTYHVSEQDPIRAVRRLQQFHKSCIALDEKSPNGKTIVICND
jgi:hypothetical protein